MDTSQSNLHTWIDAYIQECKVQRQLSPHTVKNYQRQLEVVVKHCQTYITTGQQRRFVCANNQFKIDRST
jgi:site-specific recombinase XerC